MGGYNMWRVDKLVLTNPTHYQWGITHYPNQDGSLNPPEPIDPEGNLHLLPQSTYHLGQAKAGSGKNKKIGSKFWYPWRFCAQVYNKETKEVRGKGKKVREVIKKFKAVRMVACHEIPLSERNVWSLKNGHLSTQITEETAVKANPERVKYFSRFVCKGRRKDCAKKRKVWTQEKRQFLATDWGTETTTRDFCLYFTQDYKTGKVKPGAIRVLPCLRRPRGYPNCHDKRSCDQYNAGMVKFDRTRSIIRLDNGKANELANENMLCIHPKLRYDEDCSKDNKNFRFTWTDLQGSKCIYSFSWNQNDEHHRYGGPEGEYRKFGWDYLADMPVREMKLSPECKAKGNNDA